MLSETYKKRNKIGNKINQIYDYLKLIKQFMKMSIINLFWVFLVIHVETFLEKIIIFLIVIFLSTLPIQILNWNSSLGYTMFPCHVENLDLAGCVISVFILKQQSKHAFGRVPYYYLSTFFLKLWWSLNTELRLR